MPVSARKGALILVLIIISRAAHSQTIPVGTPEDEQLKSLQLSGKIDPSISLTSRPFFLTPKFNTDSLYKLLYPGSNLHSSSFHFGKSGVIEALPVRTTFQYNTHHPYGWNDGPMIPAKGFQTLISAGFFARYGPLSAQIAPEFVYAANPPYEHIEGVYGNSNNTAYTRLFPGQSSIRLNVGKVSAGISTENLWWGPGVYNSLLMSNNAPGFLHLTFNSTAPVKTWIGSFEWQIVSGRLEDGSDFGSELYNLRVLSEALAGFGTGTIFRSWRYMNALTINYRPRWVRGLVVGASRAFMLYHNDLGNVSTNVIDTYLPSITGLFKIGQPNEDAKNRDQLASIFARYNFVHARAGIYFEYGFEDYAATSRDLFMDPTHSASFLIGLEKQFLLSKQDSRLDFNVEITQLQPSSNLLLRPTADWYQHGQILQGYTNYDQIIGAGVGTDNNVQTLAVTYTNCSRKIGFVFERLQHEPVQPAHPNNWTDISIAARYGISFRSLTLTGFLQIINSDNYMWSSTSDNTNLHLNIKLSWVL